MFLLKRVQPVRRILRQFDLLVETDFDQRLEVGIVLNDGGESLPQRRSKFNPVPEALRRQCRHNLRGDFNVGHSHEGRGNLLLMQLTD